MATSIAYAVRINETLPIVDVAGKFINLEPEMNITTQNLLMAAVVVIYKVEMCREVLLEYSPRPITNDKCFYFSAGFKSYKELFDFLDSMNC